MLEDDARSAEPTHGPAAASDTKEVLAGLRVLDVATFIAAPFCGTILGDFGAEVIKVEQPGLGDPLRQFGSKTECGDSLVWLSEARNKKSITLDLRTKQGAEIFKGLVAKSDVVLENFRPGTLEKWGLGYDALKAVNPGLVMLRISAYGQNGPKSQEPGFARIAHAFSGLTALAGESDGPPVVPGSTSLADYISGMWGAIGVLIALREREQTGQGQFIDIGLYESVFRLLDEIAPAFAKFGTIRERMGADTVNVVPHSHYKTASGSWVAVACTSDKMFERIATVMGRPELASDPNYSTSAARVARRAEVNAMVADWIGGLSQDEVIAQCKKGEVPCGPVNTIKDIFEDAQFKARGNLVEVQDPRIGPVTVPSAMPRLSDTPPRFKHTGRPLGADTHQVIGDLLGFPPDTLVKLKADKVI